MKITKLPYSTQYNTSLPSHSFHTMKGENPSRNASKRMVDEIYLKPIAVIENPLTKKILKSEIQDKGTYLDIYAWLRLTCPRQIFRYHHFHFRHFQFNPILKSSGLIPFEKYLKNT